MFKAIKSWIYPSKCMLCRQILEAETEGHLCEKCYTKVLRNHLCQKCGRPYGLGESSCTFCKKEELGEIEQIVALFPYKDYFRQAVLRWKYKGIRKYAKGYADLFVNDLCFTEKFQVDALVPVPLAPSRERMRGFNQSLDLAHEISKLTGIPVHDLLTRKKDTKPQSKCTREERLSNIKGCIQIKNVKDLPELKRIAIIDDIYTTGATIKDCIRAIREELPIKNEQIYLLIVCIGV